MVIDQPCVYLKSILVWFNAKRRRPYKLPPNSVPFIPIEFGGLTANPSVGCVFACSLEIECTDLSIT